MRKLQIISFIVIVLIAGGVAWWTVRQNDGPAVTDWSPDPNILVVTTNQTMAHFVEIVSGDVNTNAGVTPIIASDIEPHDYEPSTTDVAFAIEYADVFVAVGAGFDPWAKGIVEERDRLGKANVVLLEWNDADPHFWLDPVTLSDKITILAAELAVADSEHRDVYLANAEEFRGRLNDLDAYYRSSLSKCELREVVTTHDAFGYLAARYDIEVHAVTGISPEDEPTARDLAELADLMRQQGITTVFIERTESDDLARTLAEEVGAEIAYLDTFETVRQSEDTTEIPGYLEIMDENLVALRNAMLCQ